MVGEPSRSIRVRAGILLSADVSGLPKDSVLNVSQIVTLDRSRLDERVNNVSEDWMATAENGLRLVMDL